MASEIARMFTSLGFKVDLTGLNQFEAKVRSATQNMNQFARKLHSVSGKLTTVTQKVLALNKALNKDQRATGKGTSGYYSKLASYVERVDKAHNKLNQTAPSVVTSLNNIRASVHKSSNAWERYTNAVTAAKQALRGLSVGGVPSGGRITINTRNITNNYAGGGRGAGSGTPRPNSSGYGSQAGDGGTTIIGGLSGFMRSMTPATMLAGGAVSAGFAFKEMVQAGREVQKMQNVMLMASKGNQDVLKQNLGYVESTAKEMGVSFVEFGQAYSKMLMATDTSALTNKDKEKMFKDLSTYMVAIGQSEDDQKGTFRALTQMFTKGKIQAEEMLQMAERGVPAASMIKKAAMESLKITSEEYEKLQQKGMLDPAKILPRFAEMLGNQARDTGAAAKAMSNSVSAQQRLKDEWKKFSASIMESGLDKGLGTLFNSLAELLKLLTPIAKGLVYTTKALIGFSKTVGETVSSNKVLAGVLGVVLIALLRYRGATRQSWMITRIFNLNLKTLWRIFGSLIKRAGLVGLAIVALGKVFTDVSKHMGGEDNWISVLIMRMSILGLKFDIAILKAKEFWQALKYYSLYGNPLNALNPLYTPPDDKSGIPKQGANPFSWILNIAKKSADEQKARDRANAGIGLPQGIPIVPKQPTGKLTIEIKEDGKVVGMKDLNFGDMLNYTYTQR